jgi:hypothetical protein
MKHLVANLFAAVALIPAIPACKKTAHPPAAPRNVQYILYTSTNFTGNNGQITFELIMKNGRTVLFDSLFTPMNISDIPDKAHAIVVNKLVPAGNEGADLQVGFLYAIQNVGNSWFLDTCKAGDVLKKVEYDFQ